MALEGGDVRAVTPEGTESGRVSPDGRVVCARVIGGGQRLFPVEGGPSTEALGVTETDTVIRWSPDGSALWVYTNRQLPVQIDSVEVATGRRVPLGTIDPDDRSGVVIVYNVSLADDPKVVAYDVRRRVSHLYVVDHGP
jgi:hypothetical protein